jgi:hypothetical protein
MAVSVRYIVDDVDAAIAFYTEQLDSTVELHPAPGFAMLSRGELQRQGLDTPRILARAMSVSAASRRGQTLGPSASRTWAAWPSALTLCQARLTRPCSSTKKVERSTPMLVWPYLVFSPQAP